MVLPSAEVMLQPKPVSGVATRPRGRKFGAVFEYMRAGVTARRKAGDEETERLLKLAQRSSVVETLGLLSFALKG